jgi:predicted Fe-Mo cluster-binding NifX family protein
MSYKVAIATHDNITIENHFGRAELFSIYTIHDDFTYAHEESRSWQSCDATSFEPKPEGSVSQVAPKTAKDCGCSSGSADSKSAVGTVGYALQGEGCGSGGGCGAGGCGAGGCGAGGCGPAGDADTPADPRLERTAEALSDVHIVIAGTLGAHAQAVLLRRGIRAFAVQGGISRALDKLIAFEKRQHARFAARDSS